MTIPEGVPNGFERARGPARLVIWVCFFCGLLPLPAFSQSLVVEQTEDPISRYLEEIEAAENEYGSYAPQLSDLYSGLGQAYLETGDFDSALDVMNRGVLVIRVNSGLMSAEQINALFEVAEIENFLEEYKEADQVIGSIRLINDKAYRNDPASRLRVYEQLSEWYQNHRPLKKGQARFADYRAVQEITANVAQLSERVKGLWHPDTGKAYRMLGQSHFRAAQFVLKHGVQIEQSMLVFFMHPPHVQRSEMISVQDYLTQGGEAFEKYVQSVDENEDHTPIEYAEALAQLGDWYLVSDKPRTAWEKYETAYQVLLESDGSPQLADAYLGSPAPLTLLREDTDFAGFPTAGNETEAQGRVQLSMTVSRFGEARYVEIVGAPESLDDKDLKAIKDKVERTVFRPATVGGDVVPTNDYEWGFSIAPAEDNS